MARRKMTAAAKRAFVARMAKARKGGTKRRRRKNPGNKAAHRAGKCKICGEQMLPVNRPGWRHVSGPDWTKCTLERIERRQKRRAGNPAKTLTGFQVAALKGGKVYYLSGLGLSTERSAASTYFTLQTARRVAGQLKKVAPQFGITRIAVVTKFDTADSIRRFLPQR